MARNGSSTPGTGNNGEVTVGGFVGVFLLGMIFLVATSFLVYRALTLDSGTSNHALFFAVVIACAAHLFWTILLWKTRDTWHGTEQARKAHIFLVPCAATSALNLCVMFIFMSL